MSKEHNEEVQVSNRPKLHPLTKYWLDQVSFTLRLLAQSEPHSMAAMEVADVWRVAARVVDAAQVEHQRLLGMDVSAAEARLVQQGGQVWSDLIVVSTDSKTDGEPTRATTQQTSASAEAPQPKYFTDTDGVLYLGIPVPALPVNGEEVQS